MPHQYAYLPHLGTTDAILQLLDDCTMDLDKATGKYVQLACLDFPKAFDRMQPSTVIRKIVSLGVNQHVVNLLQDFLMHRTQRVRVNNHLSDSTDMPVGAPQGTKLGPILWLFYVNDLKADGFNVVKYADDTTFYRPVKDPQSDTVAPAIWQTELWASDNSMLLNTEKTVIMNISLNRRTEYREPVALDNNTIMPSDYIKFLGVHIDKHLSFTTNVDRITSKASSRIYLLRQLRILGMDTKGLRTFYCANIRSVLTYAAPAWYFLLSKQDQDRLEKVQRYATRIILPDCDYAQRLEVLALPTLCVFIETKGRNLFSKIVSDKTHPLHTRVRLNTNRTSSRKPAKFYAPQARTAKRAASFFAYFTPH